MIGEAVNQIDNIITFRIDDDYQFGNNDLAEIKALKNNYLQELRGLFWELLTWIIKKRKYLDLPDTDRKWFKDNEPFDLRLEKLYVLIRWRVGFIETSWRPDGFPVYIPKSTSNEKITQKEFSELYERVYLYFAKYINMINFDEQHREARERLNKY